MNIDYSRITAEITKQEARLNAMADFLQNRATKLTSAADDIEALLLKHKCILPKMENAYSNGYGVSEYAESAAMKITCRAVLTEGVKNKVLYEKKLATRWEHEITPKHNDIIIDRVYVNGGNVEIHIFIK